MRKLIDSLKYIKFNDLISCLILILVLIPSFIFSLYLKLLKKEIWLICEDGKEARDNGYHLFKYIRTNHPSDLVYYVCTKNSFDYNKIKNLGNIVEYKSLKHWIYYLVATKNISTHKYGNPSAPIFYVLHNYKILKNKRIFLQHGITQNDSPWIYYKNTKFDLFICAALKEYEYIKEKFGYPDNNLAYLGFPRFDNLINSMNKKQIVLMPTWRTWLGRETNLLSDSENFNKSKYYTKYQSLISNKKLISYLEKNDITLYFYPHRNMQKYISEFKVISKNIKVVGNEVDIQDLLRESSLMITDYSSVAFDFAYMKKPVYYYQFDKKEFRKSQLQEGYFSYENDGFGKVIDNENILVDEVIDMINKDYVIDKVYEKKIDSFFKLNDKDNCKRNYEKIKSI